MELMIKHPKQIEQMQGEKIRKLILLSAHKKHIIAELNKQFFKWGTEGITPNFTMIKKVINNFKE